MVGTEWVSSGTAPSCRLMGLLLKVRQESYNEFDLFIRQVFGSVFGHRRPREDLVGIFEQCE